MKQKIPTAVAILVGLTTLLGYFASGLRVHMIFIRWAAALAAVAFLLGILNLLGVHWRRISSQDRDWPYSFFLILSIVLVIAIAFIEGNGPGGPAVTWLFHSVLLPLEAAAASLLVIFLATAGFRALRRKPTWTMLVFVATVILVLLAAIPLPGTLGHLLTGVRGWVVQVFATAGARGMVLGVALGTIATGLRVLVGVDRPHSEREP